MSALAVGRGRSPARRPDHPAGGRARPPRRGRTTVDDSCRPRCWPGPTTSRCSCSAAGRTSSSPTRASTAPSSWSPRAASSACRPQPTSPPGRPRARDRLRALERSLRPAKQREEVRIRVQAGEPWDALCAEAVLQGWTGSRRSPESPDRPARRRSRTSAPTGRRSRPRSRPSTSSTARPAPSVACRRPSSARLPHERVQAGRSRASCSRSSWCCIPRSAPGGAQRAGRVRPAGRRARRAARHPGADRRAPRHRARAARARRAWCSTTGPGVGERRLVLHQPDRVRALRQDAPARGAPLAHLRTTSPTSSSRSARAATAADP